MVLGPHMLRHLATRRMVAEAVRGGWYGALACEVGLFGMLDRVCEDQHAVMLAVYRAHHARAVSTASPLALDLLAHHGIDPGVVAAGLVPNGRWRRWICGPRPLLASGMAKRWKGRVAPPPDADHDRRAFLHGGLVLREWMDRRGALGVRLSPAGLEVGARLGGVHLRTLGGVATLTVGTRVPETVKSAAIGRLVDEVFGHPVLEGRGYVISGSGDYESDVPFRGEPPWRVAFAAEPVPWRVPWGDA